ncbi:MAG: hypothetical protein ACI93R_001732 [Flavobacteriales bacterium]|jgi:hypothetical protein
MVCCMTMLNWSKFSRPEGRPTRVRAWDWFPNWTVGWAVGRASARQSLAVPCRPRRKYRWDGLLHDYVKMI